MCPRISPTFFVPHRDLPHWDGSAAGRMAGQWVSERASYERLFRRARGEVAIGEVSPAYLQCTSTPRLITELCHEAKIVAILRHPVDRAYAQFVGRRRDGLESRLSFVEVVESELSRPFPSDIAFGHYLAASRYHHFLHGYFEHFPRNRIRIFLFEELVSNAKGLMSDLFDFIGVDPAYIPEIRRHNRTGVVRNTMLRRFWAGSVSVRTRLRPYVPRPIRDTAFTLLGEHSEKPKLGSELRRQVLDVFREDIQGLAKLIGRDLSGWLNEG